MSNQITCPECGNQWYISGMKTNVYCFACRTNVTISVDTYL